ncbi:short-chain fatty acyl-CoA regulator family protein [Octadecabacter sp. CECT 8868]|uniref:short-chain fatty acyl-CoA regulator family protein n=1 Tax=Octadecabacter algicola TaxID=2909342 RepID=UPI001F2B3197|nr:XRE family transcriptional regulator [Octadecabacter algicola]MCF2904281.1 short-chain fatty acyl-CoA regulator family protein [Octadecabacter algicola]
MADRILTGTRVRNRRLDLGLRQSAVAERVGISGSYLNLIEHNRRRIGGKLLGGLARVLEIDQAQLEDETSASVITPLKVAAVEFPSLAVGAESAEEFASRFPGWAGVINSQQAHIERLTAKVDALANRLAHDTKIATSLHEVISTATAIRSTASILVETPDLDSEWQGRFHTNIDTDSARLAESSQALLGLLDIETGGDPSDVSTVVEQAEALFAARGFHFPECENGDEPDWPDGVDGVAGEIASGWARDYIADAARLPLAQFSPAAEQMAFDPARLAARFDVPVELILRRLAQLPASAAVPPMGLVRCDSAGVITFQKPILDFRLPRAGSACPLWPLFQALSQPGHALRSVARMSGAARTTFECFSIAAPVGPVAFGVPPRIEATMLVRPAQSDEAPNPVGPGCRICTVEGCTSRRQPSVVQPKG